MLILIILKVKIFLIFNSLAFCFLGFGFVGFFSAEDQMQGLAHTKQALYH
jgi:hypothetical protein